MKSIFVKSITAGQSLIDQFQVARCERKVASTQKPYLALALSDKTGQIEARFWSVPDELAEVETGAFIKAEAVAETYRDELQLKIMRMRVLTRGEYDIADFLPVSKRDPIQMLDELRLVIDTNVRSGEISGFLYRVIADHEPQLLIAPAAKSKHQTWLGGLLEHILNLCEAAVAIAPIYELDMDILIASAILHDIGKIRELEYDEKIDMAPIGKLVGHILIGSQMLSHYEHLLLPDVYLHLQHIIGSHHGQIEWGAARVPASREAWAFHIIDLLDSKIAMVDAAIAEGVDQNGFTAFHRDLGTALWNGSAASKQAEKEEVSAA